jgi:putative ABC transport system substrate-binding protein
LKELDVAARTLQVRLRVLEVTAKEDIHGAFARVTELKSGALLIVPDSMLTSHAALLGTLASRQHVPAIYQYRDFVNAGGLMSYGTNFTASFRQVGTYTARILKGEIPADLPVQQATNLELIINLRTAKALKLDVPLTLLGRADDVIE